MVYGSMNNLLRRMQLVVFRHSSDTDSIKKSPYSGPVAGYQADDITACQMREAVHRPVLAPSKLLDVSTGVQAMLFSI